MKKLPIIRVERVPDDAPERAAWLAVKVGEEMSAHRSEGATTASPACRHGHAGVYVRPLGANT